MMEITFNPGLSSREQGARGKGQGASGE